MRIDYRASDCMIDKYSKMWGQVFNKIYLIIVSIITTLFIDNVIDDHVDSTKVSSISCSPCRTNTTNTWREDLTNAVRVRESLISQSY